MDQLSSRRGRRTPYGHFLCRDGDLISCGRRRVCLCPARLAQRGLAGFRNRLHHSPGGSGNRGNGRDGIWRLSAHLRRLAGAAVGDPAAGCLHCIQCLGASRIELGKYPVHLNRSRRAVVGGRRGPDVRSERAFNGSDFRILRDGGCGAAVFRLSRFRGNRQPSRRGEKSRPGHTEGAFCEPRVHHHPLCSGFPSEAAR